MAPWAAWRRRDWTRLGAAARVWRVFVACPYAASGMELAGGMQCDAIMAEVFGVGELAAAGPKRAVDAVYALCLVLFDVVAAVDFVSALPDADAAALLDGLVDLVADADPVVRAWALRALWQAVHIYRDCVSTRPHVLGERRWKAAAKQSWVDQAIFSTKRISLNKPTAEEAEASEGAAASAAAAAAAAAHASDAGVGAGRRAEDDGDGDEDEDEDEEIWAGRSSAGSGGRPSAGGLWGAGEDKVLAQLTTAAANLSLSALVAMDRTTGTEGGLALSDAQALLEILLGSLTLPSAEEHRLGRHTSPPKSTVEPFGSTIKNPQVVVPLFAVVAMLPKACDQAQMLRSLNLMLLQSKPSMDLLVATNTWQGIVLLMLSAQAAASPANPERCDVYKLGLSLVTSSLVHCFCQYRRIDYMLSSLVAMLLNVCEWDARACALVRQVLCALVQQLSRSAFWRSSSAAPYWKSCFQLADFIVSFVFFMPHSEQGSGVENSVPRTQTSGPVARWRAVSRRAGATDHRREGSLTSFADLNSAVKEPPPSPPSAAKRRPGLLRGFDSDNNVASAAAARLRTFHSERIQRRDSGPSCVDVTSAQAVLERVATSVYDRQISGSLHVERELCLSLRRGDAVTAKAIMTGQRNRIAGLGLHHDRFGGLEDFDLVCNVIELFNKMGVQGTTDDQQDSALMYLERKERSNMLKASLLCQGYGHIRSLMQCASHKRHSGAAGTDGPWAAQVGEYEESVKRVSAFLAPRCARSSHYLTKKSLHKSIVARLKVALVLDLWEAGAEQPKPVPPQAGSRPQRATGPGPERQEARPPQHPPVGRGIGASRPEPGKGVARTRSGLPPMPASRNSRNASFDGTAQSEEAGPAKVLQRHRTSSASSVTSSAGSTASEPTSTMSKGRRRYSLSKRRLGRILRLWNKSEREPSSQQQEQQL